MSPRAATTSPEGPAVLDRYRLIRRLGTGAFGTVWMAHDERLGRDVAVKVLSPDRILGGRFEREARAAARLAHPGIVTLYEAAVDDEGAYLVSQLVLGETLEALLADGCLSDRDVVAVGIALCDALEHAHAQGIVHRDVKPSNVLIPEAPANPAEVAKLTDFGVARVVDAEQLTLTGDVVGTLAYMAPEQADGREVGPEADLYALALVLYEALTGVNPIGHGARTAPGRRLGTLLPPLRRQRRDLPRVLGQALDLALRPRPAERGTLPELRWALVQARDEVSDTPGIVGDPWSPLTRELGPEEPTAAGPAGGGAATWRATARAGEPPGERGRGLTGRSRGEPAGEAPASGPRGPVWPERAVGALGAAGISAWVAGQVHPPALGPAPAGLAAAAAVLLLPRIGWSLLVLATVAVTASSGLPGLAVILAGGLLLAPVLLVTAPGLWGAAAGAPALGLTGLAGLAGAWPALAGRARTPWRRGALGALGWIWLLLAGAVAGRGLLLGRVATSPPARLDHSVLAVPAGLVEPALRGGALLPALAWALGAAVLPWAVGRGPARERGLRALVWAAGMTVAPALVLSALSGTDHVAAPGGLAVTFAAAWAGAIARPGLPGRLRPRRWGSESPIVP